MSKFRDELRGEGLTRDVAYVKRNRVNTDEEEEIRKR